MIISLKPLTLPLRKDMMNCCSCRHVISLLVWDSHDWRRSRGLLSYELCVHILPRTLIWLHAVSGNQLIKNFKCVLIEMRWMVLAVILGWSGTTVIFSLAVNSLLELILIWGSPHQCEFSVTSPRAFLQLYSSYCSKFRCNGPLFALEPEEYIRTDVAARQVSLTMMSSPK